MNAHIQLKDEAFLAKLQQMDLSTLKTEIYNDARSLKGFPYFYAVDLGRGPIRPINAKALRIPVGGGFIFRKSAGPSAPRNIRNLASNLLNETAMSAAQSAQGSTIRAWLVSFLNSMALQYSHVLSVVTPRQGGKLATSYRPTTTL